MAKKTTTRDATDTATIHHVKLKRGPAGELHQIAEGEAPVLTTAQGGPVADDQNTLRVRIPAAFPMAPIPKPTRPTFRGTKERENLEHRTESPR